MINLDIYEKALNSTVDRLQNPNTRSNPRAKDVRMDKPVPQLRKFSRWDPKDVDEARNIVCERLERVEKGWLGGEAIKGGLSSTLATARKYPIAFLEILSAIGKGPDLVQNIAKGFDVVPSVIAGPQAYDLQTPAMMLY